MRSELEQLLAQYPREQLKRESTEVTFRFLHTLVYTIQPKRVVELGTYLGHSSVFLYDAAKTYGGTFVGYESKLPFATAAADRLRELFPDDDNWSVMNEDVTKAEPGSIEADFAFIDVDPKNLYPVVFRRLNMPVGSFVVCHDSVLIPEAHDLMVPVLKHSGWSVINIEAERGLLLAKKERG